MSISLKFVGDLEGTFAVPAYQRGYRWTAHEVDALLNDLWANGDRPYCLQPVVVRRRGDGAWSLIDGQQRLTTLFLIFQYMKLERLQNAPPPFRLHYDTRPRSAAYLESLDEKEREANIDFFHIHGAYQRVRAWFEAQGNRRQHAANKLYGYLFDRVQVIWFEAPDDLDETALFTRLNVGRIPLTNAELVKASLLYRNARASEVAAQWDAMERDLRDPERWAFLTNASTQRYPTRIELLFDLLADAPEGSRRPRYATFEDLRPRIEASPDGFWNDVLDLHAQALEWFEDRSLYHKIGFLIAEGTPLREIVRDARQTARSALHAKLDARITACLALKRSDLDDLDYTTWEKTRRALLLMNVEATRALARFAERYSFRAHKGESWSLEHIHAQHAEGLSRQSQWQAWLREHRDALAALSTVDPAARGALVAAIDVSLATVDRETFEALAKKTLALFATVGAAPDDALDDLSNLALLPANANSALNNAVFEVKRRRILDLDRQGSFIPICTRRVFAKTFTEADAQQVHFWSARDRAAYVSEIARVLGPYLTPEATT